MIVLQLTPSEIEIITLLRKMKPLNKMIITKESPRNGIEYKIEARDMIFLERK